MLHQKLPATLDPKDVITWCPGPVPSHSLLLPFCFSPPFPTPSSRFSPVSKAFTCLFAEQLLSLICLLGSLPEAPSRADPNSCGRGRSGRGRVFRKPALYSNHESPFPRVWAFGRRTETDSCLRDLGRRDMSLGPRQQGPKPLATSTQPAKGQTQSYRKDRGTEKLVSPQHQTGP